LYLSPNKVRVIKCRRFRWTGHIARMIITTDKPTGNRLYLAKHVVKKREDRSTFKILTGKPAGV
jgi:hypothetical protein